jgi:hypothetical protein
MDIFKDFTNSFQGKLESLAKQKKFVVGNSADQKAVSALLSSDWLEKYPSAVCIDLPKAVNLYLSSNPCEEEKIDTAFTMARVNYMGTDGEQKIAFPLLTTPHIVWYFNHYDSDTTRYH